MTKLQQVKAKIIEAVPEIMELKFGCAIRVFNETLGNPVHTYCGDDLYTDGNYTSLEADGVCVSRGKDIIKDLKIEILGRPIRLADVLIAVKKVGYRSTEEWFSVLGKLVDLWNLHKDSLDDQSEETINFLYDILCSK